MDFSMNNSKKCDSTDDYLTAKPKTKLDFLAEKVLSACGLKSKLPANCFEGQDQPHLIALEKILDIDHTINTKVPRVTDDENSSSTAALLTCTNISNSFQHGSIEQKIPEYWSPPLPNLDVDKYDVELPSLEDAAPFTKEFYMFVGQMIVCALSSLSQSQNNVQKDNDCNDGVPNDKYSLYHSVDAVRITYILSVLMELNVHGGAKNRYVVKRTKLRQDSSISNDCDDFDHASFLDLLLYHTVGSTHVSIAESNSTNGGMKSNHKSVPLMNSIFKHFAVLPQLESHVHTTTRLFRTSAPTVTQDGSSTSLKIEHMKKAEIFQERLEQELRRHMESLETIAGMLYEKADSSLRVKARLQMGNLLHTFLLTDGTGRGSALGGLENTGAAGVDSILKIILRILRGFTTRESNREDKIALPEAYRDLLHRILLPLHKPSGIILWRDQQPLLGLYHKTLVQCLGTIVTFDKDLIGDVIKYIIHPDVWPLEGKKEAGGTRLANTPKLVLLLHEIDTFVSLLEVDSHTKFSDVAGPLVFRLCSCISSDNSRSSERALEFFKNKAFKALVKNNLSQVMKPLLRALCRVDDGMEVPWNPTVRKMTLLVLRELEDIDNVLFEESCKDLLAIKGGDGVHKSQDASINRKPAAQSALIQIHDEAPSADMISLNKSMAGWRPPPKRNVTDVNNAALTAMPPPMPRRPQNNRSGAQPPLTITGVAPWAIKSSKPTPSRSHTRNKIPTSNLKGPLPEHRPGEERSGHRSQFVPVSRRKGLTTSESNDRSKRGSESYVLTVNTEVDTTLRIRAYMEKLKPPTSDGIDESEDGISSWAKAQSSESPCLLPDLKFHNLVFGHKLGQGAFSTVKYARLISKGRTRSHWPEYAVKVVSTEKIEELGYEQSINREIAVLQIMCHPSIARLISAFRFRDGAYLILEYCSGGDLHSLIKRNGSIDEESTRFVVGEMIAALNYIHDLGFVFGDLKPENILITETGHVKLTDFGGCRPITDEARNIVKEASSNALKTLRNGDWRTTSKIEDDMSIERKPVDGIDGYDHDDTRIEGTTAYLPPEVILGGVPSKAADSWALGCVLFQCMAGRPPLLDCGGDTLTRQKIVTFELSSTGATDSDFFLESSGTLSFSKLSKNIIKRLLTKIPSERPNMRSIAEDVFFQGKDVFSFHRKAPHHLDAGTVAPSPNSQWSRRQFSSIWAPQPQDYVISNAKNASSNPLDVCNSPIIDGDEREAYFLSTGHRLLTGIREARD